MEKSGEVTPIVVERSNADFFKEKVNTYQPPRMRRNPNWDKPVIIQAPKTPELQFVMEFDD